MLMSVPVTSKALLAFCWLSRVFAMTPSSTLVASSSFRMALRPTFSELDLQAQFQVSDAIATVLLSSSSAAPHRDDEAADGFELQDVDAVLQATELEQDGDERREAPMTLDLPTTTITFAVLGTFAPSASRASHVEQSSHLDQLIMETFSRPTLQFEFQALVQSNPSLKNLIDISVEPFAPLPTRGTSESSNRVNLTIVDTVVVTIGALVLVAVAYMVYHNTKVGSMQQHHHPHTLNAHASQRNAWTREDEENSMIKLTRHHSSSLDMFSILKPNGATSGNSEQELDSTPKATEEEDSEQAMSDRHSEASEQSPVSSTEHLLVFETSSQSSSSSSKSSQKSEASQEGLSQLRSSDSSSSGTFENADLEVSSNALFSSGSHEDDDEDSASYASSGISSAQFSSRWFRSNRKPTVSAAMSEDSHDLFQVDVEKSLGSPNGECQSKSAAVSSTASLIEWARSIRVIASTSDKESVATPDETYMTPCSHDSKSSSSDGSEECKSSPQEELFEDKGGPHPLPLNELAM